MATKLVQAKVDSDLLDWFDEHFPHGARQQFISDCFFTLRALVEDDVLPSFSAYAEHTIRSTLGRD